MSTQQPPEMDLDPDAARLRQRLRALRGRYSGVGLMTELTHIHDDQVVVRAVISFSDGASVSAYAAEPTDSTGLLDGALELAEQRATARALNLLGVGDVPTGTRREQAPREEVPARQPSPPIVRPDEVNTPPVVEAIRRGHGGQAASSKADEPLPPVREARREKAAEETEPAPSPRETAAVTRPEPRPERAPTESPRQELAEAVLPESLADEQEPDLADYTWTHFWPWARGHNLSTKGQVEQKIGRPIDGLTPLDVRQLLHAAGVPK